MALDCAAFMQHAVHSEFSDPKQIAATVRFDTEEALATDVSDVAVAFRVTSSGEEGCESRCLHRPAGGAVGHPALAAEQRDRPGGRGPRCLLPVPLPGRSTPERPEAPEQSTLYALLSDCRGYLVVRVRAAAAFRTADVPDRGGPGQNRVAGARDSGHHGAGRDGPSGGPTSCVFDAKGEVSHGVPPAKGRGSTGQRVRSGRLWRAPSRAISPTAPNAVDFALACGAALAPAEKANSVNLRNDHMPYLGKKRRLQNAVRFLSISVTILLLAVGVYFHSQLIRVNKQRESLRDKLEAGLPARSCRARRSSRRP